MSTGISSGPEGPSVILPPSHLRNIIDKTASFVARNGVSFETRILENERGNPKFSFLQITDPYRPYYDAKVTELRTLGNQAILPQIESSVESKKEPVKIHFAPTMLPPPSLDFAKLYYSTKGIEGTEEILQPPPMTAISKDIISLTALFAARNGRGFVSMLAEKEATNPQFEFLKATSIFHPVFARLVEAYTRIMAPSPALILKLSELSSNGFQKILNDSQKRADYKSTSVVRKAQIEEDAKKDRELFLATDWSEFIVVEKVLMPEIWAEAPETVSYASPLDLEYFRTLPLIQQRQMITNVLLSVGAAPQQTYSTSAVSNPSYNTQSNEEQEMLMSSEEEEVEMTISSGDEGSEKVQNEYVPRAMALKNISSASATSQICPRCKQRIPISEMAEHVRLELLDPKWKEQSEKHALRSAETNLVSASQISQNLQKLVNERTGV